MRLIFYKTKLKYKIKFENNHHLPLYTFLNVLLIQLKKSFQTFGLISSKIDWIASINSSTELNLTPLSFFSCITHGTSMICRESEEECRGYFAHKIVKPWNFCEDEHH